MPSAGGDAVQAYSPIRRIHPDGSEDGQVFSPRTYGNAMAVTPNAFYGSTATAPPTSFSVQALRFPEGKASQVLPLDFAPRLGLSLTPDERYLLLTKPNLKGTDLMLVEGFR